MRLFCIILLMLSGCGYTSKGNEAVGQVKKVIRRTPLLCPDYAYVDISLGVMIDGKGSMSSEDFIAVVSDKDDINLLSIAAKNGSIVKITYDTKRYAYCTPNKFITKVMIEK